MRRIQTPLAVLVVVSATLAAGCAAAAGGSSKPPGHPVATSAAWYVADSCTWTPQDRRNCRAVLTFLAAFDRGRAEAACGQLSGRYLAQRNIGGLAGCVLYLRRHGLNRRIEYSIVSSRLRPDGGEVVYTINPPGRRSVERRYIAITIVEGGAVRIDALTPIEP